MQFSNYINSEKNENIEPGLYIVSTPIGNLGDITLRALMLLKNSHFILCEDTRRSSKLLLHFKIKNKLIAYHKFNEKKISAYIIDLIKKKNVVSLISDSGTPIISDPGLYLIKQCINENLNIFPIPGPSSVTSAVSVSGFTDRYLFYGFLPKSKNETEKLLKNLSTINFSIVFFTSGKKINFYLEMFKYFFLNRDIFIAKEMTKIHETFIRGKVEEIQALPSDLRGEFTIVISPEKNLIKKHDQKINESVKLEIERMSKKYSHKDIVEFISKKENLPKKIIYNYFLKIKK